MLLPSVVVKGYLVDSSVDYLDPAVQADFLKLLVQALDLSMLYCSIHHYIYLAPVPVNRDVLQLTPSAWLLCQ